MKNQPLLALGLLIITSFAKANVLTVSNNLGHPTAYTDIPAAISAASAGDTIYVLGSLTHYSKANINKKINIFGPGYLPQKDNTLTAIIDGIEFQSNCDGTTISGMIINGGVTFDNQTFNDITITRNSLVNAGMSFNSSTITNNLKFINNIMVHSGNLLSPGSAVFNNFLVENNVIANSNGPLVNGGFTSNTTIFKNNIFMCNVSNGNGTYPAFGQVRQITLTNNIFIGYKITYGTSGIDYSTFDHNLAYLVSGSYGSDPFAAEHNISISNIYDENPGFVSADLLYPSESSNYNLQAGSPCLHAASDGGQQGVYGGDPNANWALSLMPALPYIISLNLSTATINAGGSISATVISKSHN
ncbi:MAG TPA: hypothetical protein VG738_01845 [Chitinophagaceae bacterium]|nr:hypothetical protein [Chitinophagaceae bacterium]